MAEDKNNNTEYSLDFNAIINELKNSTINKMITMAIPDQEQSKGVEKFFRAFNRRGISSEVVMAVMLDIAKENENEQKSTGEV